MAKGHKHIIVGALTTHLKAAPWNIEFEFGVVQAFNVLYKHMCLGSQLSALSLPS